MFFLLKKAIKVECHSLEAMAGPTNYVVDYTYTLDPNQNMLVALYWRIGGATYHVNNPRLVKDEWPDDGVIQRKWVVRNRNDPGWRVVVWRNGWQDWFPNNEDFRNQENEYVRQLCFGFLNL